MARVKWQGRMLAGVAAVLLAGSAMAAETAPHKGWFVGGGVVGGGEFVRTGTAATSQNRFSGGGDARFGYGITDQVVLMMDNGYFYSRKSGRSFNTYDGQLRVQVYPIGNFFFATGGGVAIGQILSGATTKTTKTGLATTTTAGYEIRPKDELGITIEGGYNYRRLGGQNHHSPVVAANLHYYF